MLLQIHKSMVLYHTESMLRRKKLVKEYINESLEKYIEEGHNTRGTCPGYKRQPLEEPANFWNGVYAHDFTEAKDLDDMHEPELFIADSIAEMKECDGTFATYA